MLQKNKWYVNLDVFNVHHLLTKIIAQDNLECKQEKRQNVCKSIYFLCTNTLKQQKAAAGRLLAPSCSLQFLIIFVRSIPRCDIPARHRRHR